MTNRTQKNYRDSFLLGKKAEAEMKKLLLSDPDTISVEEVDFQKHGFDLRYTTRNEKGDVVVKNIEVKDLAGGYETGVVEKWANNEKTKRPWWWLKGDTDIIAFKNASERKWFFYDAKKVINWLEKHDAYTTRANNGNKHDSGVLVKFYWNSNKLPKFANKDFIMDGFLMESKGL